MDKEQFDAIERARGANRRAEEKERRIVWRAVLRKQQAEAKVRIETLLGSSGISETDFNYLCIANNNRRGPRPDQIERIDKLWVKYELVDIERN